MKKRNGFTLIELLAVIVILGIIGLITTPLLLNYVKESKEDSIKISLDNIERAADMYFVSSNIKQDTVLDLTSGLIELKNNNISKGIVVGNRKGIKTYIYQNGYCGVKDGKNITVKKTTIEDCNFNVDNNIEVITSNKIPKDKQILGYRIYGNTVDNTSLGDNNKVTLKLSGKNLLDRKQSLHQGIREETGVSFFATPTFNNVWVINNLKPSTEYTIIFDTECLNIPIYDKTDSTFRRYGFYLYSGVSGYLPVWFNQYDKNFTLGEKYSSVKTIITPSNLFDSQANYRILGYTNRYLKNDVGVLSTMKFTNIQIEEGTEATPYEPYLEPKEYTITLSEPLRKYGTKVDYIDSSINQIVRNVGVRADGNLYELDTPTYEYIKLPSITNLDGTTIVSSSDGNINSSKLEIIVNK